jgi:hypothetical protein
MLECKFQKQVKLAYRDDNKKNLSFKVFLGQNRTPFAQLRLFCFSQAED